MPIATRTDDLRPVADETAPAPRGLYDAAATLARPVVDEAFVRAFEERLDPADPLRPETGARIIGYGEISTVLAIDGREDVVFKRMAGFRDDREVVVYCRLVDLYCAHLTELGIDVVPTGYVAVESGRRRDRGGRAVYLLQPRLDAACFGNAILREGDDGSLDALLASVLDRLGRVWARNLRAHDDLVMGLDGQISNWAWLAGPDGSYRPYYIDVGSPLMRRDGVEQLQAELGLRAMPAPLAWLFGRFVLGGVLDRYYDLREVLKDLVGNFIKEGRPDRMDAALARVNGWLAGKGAAATGASAAPIGAHEVRAYYRSDAWIWRVFQGFRRADRFVVTRVLRRRYDYVLPEGFRR